MKTMKTLMLSAALVVPTLVGAASAEPTKVDFWVSWTPGAPDAVAAEKAIADFEASHPEIDVVPQVINYGALHDKLVTAIAGGDAPEISWGLSEWFGELNRMGALADLSEFAGSSEAVSAFYPSVVENLSIDGDLKALPNYLGIRALMYHAEMLEAAGVEPPKTWDELITTSQKIKEATGKYGFGIAGKGVRSPQEILMYFGQNDVSVAERMSDGKYRNTWGDDPAMMARAVEVFAFYKRMLDEGAVPPQSSGWGWEEEDTNFALGQYAMVVNGSWMGGRIEQNPETMAHVKVTAPAAGKSAATFFEIAPLYVFDTEASEATLEFASYLLSQEVQQEMFPNRSAREDVKGDATWGEPFTALAPSGISFPPISLGSIPDDMAEALGRVILRGDSPEEAAKWLGEAINKTLRRSGQLSKA